MGLITSTGTGLANNSDIRDKMLSSGSSLALHAYNIARQQR